MSRRLRATHRGHARAAALYPSRGSRTLPAAASCRDCFLCGAHLLGATLFVLPVRLVVPSQQHAATLIGCSAPYRMPPWRGLAQELFVRPRSSRLRARFAKLSPRAETLPNFGVALQQACSACQCHRLCVRHVACMSAPPAGAPSRAARPAHVPGPMAAFLPLAPCRDMHSCSGWLQEAAVAKQVSRARGEYHPCTNVAIWSQVMRGQRVCA